MHTAHLHFLIAEADPAQRRALAQMLGQCGAGRITEAPDGHTALRAIGNGITPPVDVAIIDLALPGMDGLELVRRLAEARSRVAVIITGAHSASLLFSVETLALAQGIDLVGTLAKPVAAAPLQALLAHHAEPSPADARAGSVQPASFAEVGRGLQAREFEPYFQPKIALATGQVQGLEMFARWRHPERGVLEPSAFMPALAQAGRLDFLDWSMIEKSVAACRTLHDQGIPISFSVNVAPGTLAHPRFLEQIAACMERHSILPGYLSFEISESAVLSTDAPFLERLLRLRLQGYGLALGDYGTARSNLQLLARIPFSELKIDRSFVDGASKKQAIGTVLRSCLGLARSLERPSVAVGVETRQDWDFLQKLGCTYAQGYYIAKPMPVEDFPAWLAEWRLFF